MPSTIAKLIHKVASSGRISRKDYMQLTSMILSITTMTPLERSHINQILDAVQTGKITLID
ncbi:hypothetical protein ACFVKH_10475 [Almyronema epifaneia S1]|uniref:Uncharacterized protein n=2 Tax=Almyronema TaxID=3114804 RepID=A0ABW6IG70_9CYAN